MVLMKTDINIYCIVLSCANMNCIDRGAASIVRSFWLLGLLNNAPWVLMLACATNIASGGVALVVSRCIKNSQLWTYLIVLISLCTYHTYTIYAVSIESDSWFDC